MYPPETLSKIAGHFLFTGAIRPGGERFVRRAAVAGIAFGISLAGFLVYSVVSGQESVVFLSLSLTTACVFSSSVSSLAQLAREGRPLLAAWLTVSAMIMTLLAVALGLSLGYAAFGVSGLVGFALFTAVGMFVALVLRRGGEGLG